MVAPTATALSPCPRPCQPCQTMVRVRGKARLKAERTRVRTRMTQKSTLFQPTPRGTVFGGSCPVHQHSTAQHNTAHQGQIMLYRNQEKRHNAKRHAQDEPRHEERCRAHPSPWLLHIGKFGAQPVGAHNLLVLHLHNAFAWVSELQAAQHIHEHTNAHSQLQRSTLSRAMQPIDSLDNHTAKSSVMQIDNKGLLPF